MGIFEDYTFQSEALMAKLIRTDEVAQRVEADPSNSKDKRLLQAMTVHLEQMQTDFNELINKLVQLAAKQTPKVQRDYQSELEKFDALFYNVQAICAVAFPPSESQTVSSNQAVVGPAVGGVPSLGITLPKLTIKPFSGELKEWQHFADLFEATVHSNSQLSDIQKHMHLRSALLGEALSTVSAVPLTAAAYPQAWKLLRERYHDPQRLTDSYLQAILELPQINKGVGSIRLFVTLLKEYLAVFRPLGHEVEDWAIPLLFILRGKLTAELREGWQRKLKEGTLPSLTNFQDFLVNEAELCEAAQSGSMLDPTISGQMIGTKPRKPSCPKSSSAFVVGANNLVCILCKNNHEISQCKKFEGMKPSWRFRIAKERKLCLMCLAKGHFSKECPAKLSCSRCNGNHHRLLHLGGADEKLEDKLQRSASPCGSKRTEGQNSTPSLVASVKSDFLPSATGPCVLLMTVSTSIMSSRGSYEPVRVLLDCASQESLITLSCVQRLGLRQSMANPVQLFGLGSTPLGTAKAVAHCKFKPAEALTLEVDALVVNSIAQSQQMPSQLLPWRHLSGLKLADDGDRARPIDILLGAEWFPLVVTGRKVPGPPRTPSAFETIWGYCLLGKSLGTARGSSTFCTVAEGNLELLLRQFWLVEEPPQVVQMSPADIECEDHYRATVKRLHSGRYIVELPFLSNRKELGDSRQAALRRFLVLERRLEKNPILKQQYVAFMRDYLKQKHMLPAPPASAEENYYIPHHCIFRQNEEGEITKFRVVFDASMKSTTGVSLNQVLHSGPSLQLEIVDILLKFRIHEVVLITDIKQMYRNILVSEKHYPYQRIFWREDAEDPLKEFSLATVTYGVSAAPFLALRTLHQLVKNEGETFPAAAAALKTATYMDDVVTSVKTLEVARRLQQELIVMLGKAGFQLRKWISNRQELLAELPPEYCALSREIFSFKSNLEDSTKILGFLWNPVLDYFSYQVQPTANQATKRGILSMIARLYDPLGYLSAVTFVGKYFIQHLWQAGVEWDAPAPAEVQEKWIRFREELPLLVNLKIPRWLHISDGARLQLHGFSDSSERGYAGVVYLRVESEDGKVMVWLLLARAKVAPLKRITLPRLELCAAVLVSKLLKHVTKTLSEDISIDSVIAWTDSTIALSWIKSSPHRWNTFVANRVSQIQELLSPNQFRYVPTDTNPADCASRGLFPSELLDHPLWWNGPGWLSQTEECWPMLQPTGSVTEEAKALTLNVIVDASETPTQWMNRISSLSTLKRATAIILRWASGTKSRGSISGDITAEELSAATSRLVKLVQRQEFSEEIARLGAKKPCRKEIGRLNPFIDDEQLLRVGGRLSNAKLPFAQRHPLLLPRSHHLTNLIIDEYHQRNQHPGPQNLHCILRKEFWIMAGRDAVRRRVGRCIQCFKAHPVSTAPLMGELPIARLEAVKAFHTTGVDYGGPYTITMGRIRKAKTMKAYICLFVCMSTRAVHLELASDLSTDAFLAAFRRFLARRGSVNKMFSDQGTNFVGAKRVLGEWKELTANESHNALVGREMAQRGISWHLIPPASPHMGGLWEAAIRSTKKLLSASIGDQILTFEEFSTVLAQIEATLNSRPLTQMSSDPNDWEALTPGHFLMMEAPFAIREPQLPDKIVNLRDRWKLVQQIMQTFWRRWRSEYLGGLQQRPKWDTQKANLEIGDLVIIKEDNAPPLQWRTGRIVTVHPGRDGVVRVATVSTKTGNVKRPVVKLCPLPINK